MLIQDCDPRSLLLLNRSISRSLLTLCVPMPHKHHQAIAAASGASKGKPLIPQVQLRPKPCHQCLVAHPELLYRKLLFTEEIIYSGNRTTTKAVNNFLCE